MIRLTTAYRCLILDWYTRGLDYFITGLLQTTRLLQTKRHGAAAQTTPPSDSLLTTDYQTAADEASRLHDAAAQT